MSYDYLNVANTEKKVLSDGTTIPVITFPYTPENSEPSVATFSAVSTSDKIPSVTLFWSAAGSNNSTIYATNSASSNIDRGPIGFNGSVNALLSSDNILYVGGEFSSVGGTECHQFCVLDLKTGNADPQLGTTGTLIGNPLSAFGPMRSGGGIQAIAKQDNLLIVGGSFEGDAKNNGRLGKGLSIVDLGTGALYPFYVNGIVNKLLVCGTELFVLGTFDYLNYTGQSASDESGLRVYANGIAKINLHLLKSFPNNAIDRDYVLASNKLFAGAASINCALSYKQKILIGGKFQIAGTTIENLAIIDKQGVLDNSWEPIIGGEVLALMINSDNLYVGGEFNYVSDTYNFSLFDIKSTSFNVHNAVCYDIKFDVPELITNWVPQFNGPVTNFVADNVLDGWVYCYGRFTSVNSEIAGYAAAIEKPFTSNPQELPSQTGKRAKWPVNMQSGPQKINQGMLQYGDAILLGGTFVKINNSSRYYFAQVQSAKPHSVNMPIVIWDLGAQVCSHGMNLNMDFTTYVRTSAYCGDNETVNQTTIKADLETFTGYSAGTLIKFFLRRPSGTGTLTQPAQVIGWKVDFV